MSIANGSSISVGDLSATLQGKKDPYGGYIVDSLSLPTSSEEFYEKLTLSLQHWKEDNLKGIWLKIPIAKSDFVPIAVQSGFKYHHAEADYLMLTYWLPSTPNTLPPNASHQVGVGAFVLNSDRHVLAVQEKNGPLKGTGVWKLPTGLVNHLEDICDGAIREVKEETGIDCEFLEVLSFRQMHKAAFDKSDLFFLCVLRPISLEITIQESEIADAKWIPFEELVGQEFFRKREVLMKMYELCEAHANGVYGGFQVHRGINLYSGLFSNN